MKSSRTHSSRTQFSHVTSLMQERRNADNDSNELELEDGNYWRMATEQNDLFVISCVDFYRICKKIVIIFCSVIKSMA
jgi:hypothetical protein